MKWRYILFYMGLVCGIDARYVDIHLQGSFANCQDVLNGNSTTDFCVYNGSVVHWGTPLVQDNLSGLEFIGANTTLEINSNSKAEIGQLIHHNWPITGNIPIYVDFDLQLRINADISQNLTIPFQLEIDETPNRAVKLKDHEMCPFANNSEWFGLYNSSLPCCPYYTPKTACSDRIRFITPFNRDYTFLVNETEYTVKIEGFVNISNLNKTLVDTFVTQERFDTSGSVFASLAAVCSDNNTGICNDNNVCTLDHCVEGFCVYNETALNGTVCNYTNGGNLIFIGSYISECFDDICLRGQCVRQYYNCSDSSSSDDRDRNDDDDVDLIPLFIPLAVLTYMCIYLLPLLLLPLLCLLVPFFYKTVSLPSVGAIVGPDLILETPIENNPLYTNLTEMGNNPLFEI